MTLPALALTAPACGTTVNGGGSGGGGGGNGGGGAGGTGTINEGTGGCLGQGVTQGDGQGGASVLCMPWPSPCAEGAGGDLNAGGNSNAGGTDGGGAIKCPSEGDAEPYLQPTSGCGISVEGPGSYEDAKCCYPVHYYPCSSGRPFLVGEEARAAAPRSGARGQERAAAGYGWTDIEAPSPNVMGLSREARARLAEAWARDGLLEHASVASFGRFALELMAAGAPADLIESAHRAALDEVRHAKLCLALAGAYAGAAIEPSRFPFGGRVDISEDLADVAARAVREGCIGETIASIQAAEQRERATDPAVRAALAVIAEDEARHAELAWRAVAWACGFGGARVHRAVLSAFEAALGGLSSDAERAGWDVTRAADAKAESALEAHGLLDEAARRVSALRAVDDVIWPSVRALFGPYRSESAGSGSGSIERA